ncbi:hypothetical protein [Desulfonema magnum]|uniref:Uncharacterized protein n=1 Tax=Desulfonema magnum TaxID=45655 RepID=A0A975GRF8_9BACT|nr:hypothetical protein [Desulfonema magnum]QTA90855.1 Uncharacterized protein dnm_069170 [Desulfonema magnum]
MNNSPKKLVIFFRVVCVTAFLKEQIKSIGLSFSPSASSIHPNHSVDVDMIISGLENGVQTHCFGNMAGFDFSIDYDHKGLNFEGCRQGTRPVYINRNEADERKLFFPGGSVIRLSRLSSIWDFSFRSADELGLATVSFFGVGLGKNDLLFSNGISEDGMSSSLSVTLENGTAEASESYGQAGVWLLKSGLARRLNHGFPQIPQMTRILQSAVSA